VVGYESFSVAAVAVLMPGIQVTGWDHQQSEESGGQQVVCPGWHGGAPPALRQKFCVFEQNS
jgi:hypothetical protein